MVQGGAGLQDVSHSLSKAIVGQFTVALSLFPYISGKDGPTQPINPDSPFGLKSLQHLCWGCYFCSSDNNLYGFFWSL